MQVHLLGGPPWLMKKTGAFVAVTIVEMGLKLGKDEGRLTNR